MSQKEKILEYLKTNGEINVMQALWKFGCYRLSARIYELREEGHVIDYVRDKKDRTKGRYIYGREKNVCKNNRVE